MPVLVERIGLTEVNCLIWVGVVSRLEALEFPGRTNPSQPKFGCCWISYFDPRADLSQLDAACLLELRKRLRSVVSGLATKGEFRMILVSNSTYNDPLLAVWGAMTALQPDYPSNPVVVHDIDTASQALGLSVADAEQVRVWVESRIERGPLSRVLAVSA